MGEFLRGPLLPSDSSEDETTSPKEALARGVPTPFIMDEQLHLAHSYRYHPTLVVGNDVVPDYGTHIVQTIRMLDGHRNAPIRRPCPC